MRKLLFILLLISFPAFAGNPGLTLQGTATANNVPVFVNNWTVKDGGFSPSSGITLGTSAAVTNPQRNGDATTGLFSAATNTVSVAVGGTDVVDIGTNGINIANGILTGTSTTNNFLNVTGTMASVNTQVTNGVEFVITGAGSSAFTQRALFVSMPAGYTGPAQNVAIRGNNASAGTGTSGWTGGAGNFGYVGTANGTASGHNVGFYTGPNGSSSLNLGFLGQATSSSNSAALNVGVAGEALNATTNVAGFFGLLSGAPTFSGTAALIADNGVTASPIFVAQNNGSALVTIGSTGNVGIGTTAPASSLDVWGTYSASGTAGVTCSGLPSVSFAVKNGIVTHC